MTMKAICSRWTLVVLGIAALAGLDALCAASHLGEARMRELFVTSDRCMACHNGLRSGGQDVSIGSDWRASMMAHSALDPYWHAAVRRETIDHPESRAAIENECSACHMPMARFESKTAGRPETVFSHLAGMANASRHDRLALDGVSCSMCHQITNRNLGDRATFSAGFDVDVSKPLGERAAYGPFEVSPGLAAIMLSATDFRPEYAPHIGQSEMCATCHTLITHTLGPGGKVVGELPEQVPYLEWLNSSYRQTHSCQSCHLETLTEAVPISSVMGEPRKPFSRHVFRGGNFFMLRILNQFRDELGVTALPSVLETTVLKTLEGLAQRAAQLSILPVTRRDGELEIWLRVENLAGHKLPTAYPSRRAWLHLLVQDVDGQTVFESGALREDGSIVGNDNDVDAASFEPHYLEITSSEQVQVYEPILGDPSGKVTTGLLTASQYLKDNRVPPQGFLKAAVPGDVAVRGAARSDPDFDDGSDHVIYRIPLRGAAGPFTVEAELRYQPIGFRWALSAGEYQTDEAERFIRYYRALSNQSSAVLARASTRVAGAP